jgi:hypothetical protein
MVSSTTFPTDTRMANTDPNRRHWPCHILHSHNLPCVVWFEDAIGYYGVSTVVFDLYILVQDIENAAQVLLQNGWNLVLQEKGRIGNAAVDYPQHRLTPPSQDSHDAELPTSCPSTFNLLPPLPDTSLPRPTTTVLLSAADWNFSLASANNTNTLVDTIYPPLPSLVDALIDSLLDCPSDNHVLQTHLAAEIASLYSWSPMLKEKAFAEQLVYEHRQYHLDVLSGMDHGTVQFISHQRNVREATRQRTQKLQECSAPNNKDLFTRDLQAEILASMPKPTVDPEGDGKDEDGWEIYDESGQIKKEQLEGCL